MVYFLWMLNNLAGAVLIGWCITLLTTNFAGVIITLDEATGKTDKGVTCKLCSFTIMMFWILLQFNK